MRTLMRQIGRAGVAAGYRRHARARLPVLMYHRVLERPDPLQPGVPDAAQAEAQFRALSELFTVLPLEEALPMQREGRLPPGAVCITFDDGYRDNHDVALPLLRRHGLTATFYIASGFLDGGRMFNDTVLEAVRRMPDGALDLSAWGIDPLTLGDAASRQAAVRQLTQQSKYFDFDRRAAFCEDLARRAASPLPGDVMMSSEQVIRMARAGMSIGGHTVNHPILQKIDADTARNEIARNREALRQLTGQPLRTFAYPNGKPGRDYGAEHANMVEQAGYEAAVSTAYGVGDAGSDRYQFPRFVLTEHRYPLVVARLLRVTSHLVSG